MDKVDDDPGSEYIKLFYKTELLIDFKEKKRKTRDKENSKIGEMQICNIIAKVIIVKKKKNQHYLELMGRIIELRSQNNVALLKKNSCH